MSALTVTPAKPRFPAPKPTTIQELEPAERVLVWAVRSWTAAGWRQQAVWRDFAARFGSDALTVMTAFERLLRDLQAMHVRRAPDERPAGPLLQVALH